MDNTYLFTSQTCVYWKLLMGFICSCIGSRSAGCTGTALAYHSQCSDWAATLVHLAFCDGWNLARMSGFQIDLGQKFSLGLPSCLTHSFGSEWSHFASALTLGWSLSCWKTLEFSRRSSACGRSDWFPTGFGCSLGLHDWTGRPECSIHLQLSHHLRSQRLAAELFAVNLMIWAASMKLQPDCQNLAWTLSAGQGWVCLAFSHSGIRFLDASVPCSGESCSVHCVLGTADSSVCLCRNKRWCNRHDDGTVPFGIGHHVLLVNCFLAVVGTDHRLFWSCCSHALLFAETYQAVAWG